MDIRQAVLTAAGRAHRTLPLQTFVDRTGAAGYGHALSLARDFVAGRPFLHLVSDHIYLTDAPATCARQVIEMAKAEACTVSAVQATRESMLPYYGTVGGRRVARRPDLYEVDLVLEKPTPSEAAQK